MDPSQSCPGLFMLRPLIGPKSISNLYGFKLNIFSGELSKRILSDQQSAFSIFRQTFSVPSFNHKTLVRRFTRGTKCVLPKLGYFITCYQVITCSPYIRSGERCHRVTSRIELSACVALWRSDAFERLSAENTVILEFNAAPRNHGGC